MKKIIISIMLVIVLVGITGCNKEDTKEINTRKTIQKQKQKKCSPITGGAYTLIFNTDGGKEIESMHICIACAPNTYQNLPVAEKEGYNFEGWYYDKELTKKVEVTNTKDIKIVPIKEKKCITGYKDITLYANYSIAEKKEEITPQTTNNNNTENNIQQNNQQGNQPSTTIRKYQELFKKPLGGFAYLDDGGSFSYQQHGAYLVVTRSSIINAMADGEILINLTNSNKIGGVLITKQTIYHNGQLENYIIVLNHVIHTPLNELDTFEPNQTIGYAARDYQNPGPRYSIYTYKDNNNQLKDSLQGCQGTSSVRWQCINTLLKQAQQYRIDQRYLIEK